MTSLQILPKPAYQQTSLEPTEWGTGGQKAKVPLWSPRPPTWHQSGQPINQFYRLTQLKKSNVRLNDQLLPKPQECDISQDFIEKPFPASHPYSSHINKFAVFPSFATTAEDPTRGVEARSTQPLHSDTPAHPYDVQIVSKIKGFPRRHEVQSLPAAGLKRGLSWCGESEFDQLTKVQGGQGRSQRFYPHPPKSVVPNLLSRSDTDRAITPSTANATRNVERLQWHTTYGREFSGLGPHNSFKLDNAEDKMRYKLLTGIEDSELKPISTNTFDPARPYEGRVSDTIVRKHQLALEGAKQPDTGYMRKPTLTEKEEDRLWNGKEYLNLPEGKGSLEAGEDFAKLIGEQTRRLSMGEPSSPYAPQRVPGGEEALGGYMTKLKSKEYERIQQIEAENRWTNLEAQKPSHDIGALSRKSAKSSELEQASTFYGHEGRYNEERAGLYRTSYNPDRLAGTMADTPNSKFDTTPLRAGNVSLTGEVELDPLLRDSKSLMTNLIPQLSDRPSTYDVFGPHDRDRYEREKLIKPTAASSRAIIQDGRGIQTSATTQGDSYNTQKFLHEYKLHPNCRAEPQTLMSGENKDLNNARVNGTLRRSQSLQGMPSTSSSQKTVKFDEMVMLAPADKSEPLRVSQSHIENPQVALTSPRTPRQGRSPVEGAVGSTGADLHLPEPMPSQHKGTDVMVDMSPLFMQQTQQANQASGQAHSAFRSHASNIMPNVGDFASTYPQTTAQADAAYSLSYKNDDRFQWAPESGTPRPQTALLNIQNRFSRTAAHARLHSSFQETNPNLIRNVHTGKKHNFKLNSQVLRGAAL